MVFSWVEHLFWVEINGTLKNSSYKLQSNPDLQYLGSIGPISFQPGITRHIEWKDFYVFNLNAGSLPDGNYSIWIGNYADQYGWAHNRVRYLQPAMIHVENNGTRSMIAQDESWGKEASPIPPVDVQVLLIIVCGILVIRYKSWILDN